MQDTMIDVQEDVAMVSPTGGHPFHKRALFLKPIASSSILEPPTELSRCFTSVLPSGFKPKKLELEIRGSSVSGIDLYTWAAHLALTHQDTWRRAGIYGAIFNSMYEIRKRSDLFVGLGEKWCCETNTFVFAWGEATVSLEDVMVLGGFSVLGDSAFSPLESREMRKVQKRLDEVRMELRNSKHVWRFASTNLWMKEFMKSGSDLEHEAFLVFWLSRYVFPDARCAVNKAVIPIAIRLARGIRIALAPAVLANIYRDLGLLKRTIVGCKELKVTIKSPFHLVQVWAWERFLELRPRPHCLRNIAESRLARWDKVTSRNVVNLRSLLDSAGEGFLWRPYAIGIQNWKVPGYFLEKEKRLVVGPDMDDEELLSFYICLRVNELVGFGTTQQYLPHRVAMQFGYDQDIPGCVDPWNINTNVVLCIPSRLSEADASERYLMWWKDSMASLKQRSLCPEKKSRNKAGIGIYHVTDPGVHSPKNAEELVHASARNVYEGNDALLPPGFPPKRHRLEIGDPMDDDDDDDLTISQAMEIRKKHKSVETCKGNNSEKLSADDECPSSISRVEVWECASSGGFSLEMRVSKLKSQVTRL